MKKKGLWIILGIVIIVNLAIFGLDMLDPLPGGGEYEEGVLRVWATWGDDRDQLQPLFDRYTRATGQSVRVATGADSGQIERALTSNTPPDVVILSTNDLVSLYYEQGLIEPLDAWIETTGINLADIYPAPLAQCEMPDGVLHCLPWGGDVFVLYWNKDLFAAAGLDPDQPPQTMEEMLEYAELLTVSGDEGSSQAGFIPDFPRPHTDLYVQMFGGSWYSDSGELAVNSQAVVDALNWQNQFYNQLGDPQADEFVSSINRYRYSGHPVYGGRRLNCQQCHRYSPKNGEKIPDHGFYNGQIAMMVDGPWQLGAGYISTYAPDLNYGVAPIPPSSKHPEQTKVSLVQGPVAVIPSRGLTKDSAADLLAWMMSPEIVAEIAYATTSLPTSKTAAQDPRFQQIPNFQVFLDLIASHNTGSIASTPINLELNTHLAKVEKEILHTGGGDPVRMLDELQAEYGPELHETLSSQALR